MFKSEAIPVKFLRLRPIENSDIPLPRYMTQNSSGMDIYAAIRRDIILKPKNIELISTGFAMEIPSGLEAQIRPRSGLAINHLISILNSPGTIDSDYRGEVKIILINFGTKPFTISRGARIAQMVFAKVCHVNFNIVEQLGSTERGSKGFGHTDFYHNI